MIAQLLLALRFPSERALTRGLHAFDAAAFPEFLARDALVVDGLAMTAQREVEVEVDCDVWPSLRALASEADAGAVILLATTASVDDLRIAVRHTVSSTIEARWEFVTTTRGTPTGDVWLARARAALVERGLALPVDERFDVMLLDAPATPAVWKALLATCGIGLADGRKLTSSLPGRVLRRAEPARAEAARVALEAAGASVAVAPSR